MVVEVFIEKMVDWVAKEITLIQNIVEDDVLYWVDDEGHVYQEDPKVVPEQILEMMVDVENVKVPKILHRLSGSAILSNTSSVGALCPSTLASGNLGSDLDR
ncbi:hypothetical protein RJT34_30159 [Clitoria ternatea]|uniref:Uncharacterized protein n=1 Tax=Clitoria ternatea TaxID=43366 RepID=A0AAN9I3T2_CLITE